MPTQRRCACSRRAACAPRRVRSPCVPSCATTTGRKARAAQLRSRGASGHVARAHSSPARAALLFDCDGVLADTERDGHRVTFNAAFKQKGLACEWSVEQYGELLKIGGGKERMTKCVLAPHGPTTHARCGALRR